MDNKIIFIFLTIFLFATLIFNSILYSYRVSLSGMYWRDYRQIVYYEIYSKSNFTEHKINNRKVFKDLHNFEKNLYISSLIFIIVSLIISGLLLLSGYIYILKRIFCGIIYKICNIINIVFCGVYSIISFAFFVIYFFIYDTDKTIRKYYIFGASKTVKNRSIAHLIANFVLFIFLAFATFLSFIALHHPTKKNEEKKNIYKNESINTNNKLKENDPIKTITNEIISEKPRKFLTKNPPK